MTITKGPAPLPRHVEPTPPDPPESGRGSGIGREQSIESGSRQGILVRRHGPSSFTVAVSDEVPYGATHEREHQNGESVVNRIYAVKS